ncbi:endonuclease/exonuclease/phosphatase family protein [Maribacter ulvicola]|uniref:Metal-dependent hydrolase, endonuclease/exonuclease/phosphatase family n=1 Tax=Maribacter ulvicola TaxID=228959 RepID=A0A1N6ZY69_9FLAO|nr:endonuclease/exonuclease/phosphatase family protein [Maribacter ulvicola]SIR31797.1 Metal-dependent hydrolase, endonuclease/exonuclease/phosphatase family [Maribacter ulvicola]
MNKRCFLRLWLLVVPLQWAFGQTNIDSTRIVRVLSYNIYHGETVGLDKQFDLDELARIINDEKPDLVALQEVDFKTNRVLKKDLVTELGLRTKMQAIFGKAMSFDGGEYGEGVLSDYSFLSTKNHTLVVREGNEPRAALEVNVIIKSNDTIKFIGTHLDHTNIETDRIDQAKQINDLFAIDEVPTILAGDLNALPGSETMHVFYKYWKQSFLENVPTYPAQEPRDKIDYILFKPANRWRVLETKVIDEKLASDHRAILSVLELLKK